jgi:glycosyltransferase involved in cell wall biosynthesis
MNELLAIKNAVHVFSGVNAFPMVDQAFKLAVTRKRTIGIMSEPFNWFGLKGKLRFVKYFLFNLKYGNRIDFILTTGKRGRWCFERTGFTENKIFEWAYFTETPDVSVYDNKTADFKLLFIGSIDKRKNILSLVDVCRKLNIINQLQIIGTGNLEKELLQKIGDTECQYLGKVPNQAIHKIIAHSDVLALPSIFDGWGAVVNEALMCGIPVIASDNCGSSALLQGIRGRVFSVKKNNLEDVLKDFITVLPYNAEQRKEIRNWAFRNISGEAAARYFTDIIKHVRKETVQRPVAPWLVNTEIH